MLKKIEGDYWPTEDWRKAEPELMGLDKGVISALDEKITGKYKNLKGIVVVRKKHIVFERYYQGCTSQEAQNVASVTKSVISALVGIAIDQGYLESAEQSVLDFFPEYQAGSGDIRKQAVTLKQVLNMTAPFAFSWKNMDSRPFEPLDRLRRQRDWSKYILDLMGSSSQSGQFQYSTPGAHLLSAVISRATGRSAREFANEFLFGPLGMQTIPDREMRSYKLEDIFGKNVQGWIKDPQGYNTGGWGLTLSPRDMARLGLLYLNGGVWEGRQVISENWIRESTAPNENDYGYLWWLWEKAGVKIFTALGYGGNMICCIPETDLVVVTTADLVSNAPESLTLVEKCILPAVVA